MAKLPAPVWISLALLAASIEPIIAKFAFRDGVEAVQLIVLKNIIGALFVLPIVFQWRSKNAGFKQIAPAGFLLFATNSLTILSLKSLSVVLLITIITCVPALVALLNSILGRDSLNARFWTGFIMCFVGVVLTLDYKDITVHWFGVVCAMAAALSSSVYRVRMEILCEKYSPGFAAAFSYFVQGFITLTLLFWAFPFSKSSIVFGGWIGFSAALANLAFVYALNMVGSTRISILTMVQRPLLIVGAALILHETIIPIQLAGIVLVMVGIQLAQVKRITLPQEHDQDKMATSNP